MLPVGCGELIEVMGNIEPEWSRPGGLVETLFSGPLSLGCLWHG